MSLSNLYPTIAPSLNLSFALTKKLDPRITFVRTTTGVFYDGVTTAKAEENLLLQSQAWATSPWFNNAPGAGNTVTNNASTAPDGTLTATSLTFGSTQFAARNQNITTVSGLSYTFSFWAKRVSGNTALRILHFDSATSSSTAFTITNDWVRYSVTVLGKSGGGNVAFGVQDDNASGFGEILLWGGQVEQRASMTAYTPTTTQAITNYIPVLQTAASGVARFDHNPTTGESLGLLVEEQRTNLLTYSAEFDNAAWTKARASITANTIVAPDGMLTGDKLVEDTTASNTHFIAGSTSFTTASASLTLSVYAKKAERSIIRLQGGGSANWGTAPSAYFNLDTGVITQTDAGTTSTITPVGNGWYRCSITGTTASSGVTNPGMNIYLVSTGTTINYTGDGYSGIYLWGAQLEAGAFPTSYIATTSASVTRNADAASMTGTNFSSWFNNAEGTIFVDFVAGPIPPSGFPRAVEFNDSTTSTNFIRVQRYSSGQVRFSITTSGATQAAFDSSTVALGATAKSIVAYKVNDIAGTVNSATPTTDTSAVVPVLTQMNIGDTFAAGANLNSTIKKLAYYPARLTNAQLQALTS